MKQMYCIVISGLIFISCHAQPKIKEITHYLFPEFTQGVILMKAGEKNETLLNYNSLTEEMIFENKGRKLAVAPRELARIDTVYIKDRRFIPLNDLFVEIICDSKWDLYVEHKCHVKEPGKPVGYGGTSKTSAVSSYSSFYSEGIVYELILPEGYETRPYTYYWLKRDGEMYKFKNMRELKKLYKEKERLFKPYVKDYGVKYDNQESIIQLIEYLESN
jgi:hypothetical protein